MHIGERCSGHPKTFAVDVERSGYELTHFVPMEREFQKRDMEGNQGCWKKEKQRSRAALIVLMHPLLDYFARLASLRLEVYLAESRFILADILIQNIR